MKEIQCLCWLGHWKSEGSRSVNKNSAWQLAYLSEKGKFWDDYQCSAPFMCFTWNKTWEHPCLVSPRLMSCCWVLLLVGLECCSLPHRLASFADSAGGWSSHCSDPVFGVIPCMEQRFSLAHTLPGSLLQPRLAMEWKIGGWTSHDVLQKAKMGMCSVLVRNRDLLGSRNCANLDSDLEISAGRPGRTSVLTVCIVHP